MDKRLDAGTRGVAGSNGCRRVNLGVLAMMVGPGQEEKGLHYCLSLHEFVDLLCVDSQGQVDHLGG
jgi:hypothetical protein